MANPVFSQTEQFKPGSTVGFDLPADGTESPLTGESTGRMTYEGVIVKAATLFLLAAGAAVIVGMFFPDISPALGMAAFVMSLVVAFGTSKPSPALYSITLTLWGGAVGGLSVRYEAAYGGIILQAVMGTAVVFAVALAVYRSGRIRDMRKVNRFLMIAVPAYVVFSLINLAMVTFGDFNMREVTITGTNIPFGLVLSIFAIAVGAFMLISDFDFVANGVRKGLPSQWEWTAAYGLVFAIIWIYLEMLRLLGYLRR